MFPHCQKITDAADVAECKGGCGYPMCSESCGDVREHRDFECAAFRERGYKVRRREGGEEGSMFHYQSRVLYQILVR